MAMLIAALVAWFLFGAIGAWFFFQPLRDKILSFNAKYGAEYAQYFKKPGVTPNPALYAKRLLWFEGGAFVVGTLLFFSPLFGLWGVGAAFFLINYVARLLKRREVEKFDNQMIDVAYAMKNSLKAGMTLQQSLHLVATEFARPASDQFAIAIREVQLGASIEDALRHIEERLPNAELKVVVNAVEILRQTGGNMVETFELIVETLKSRKRVEGKIKALTAQGRASAIILCAMPFVMALMLYFLNRPYIEPLFTTILGNILMTLVLLLVTTGWVIIKKVITIEV